MRLGARRASPAPAALFTPVNVGQTVEEFVVGEPTQTRCGPRHLVAFRTSEAAQGQNLNGLSNGEPTGDGDLDDGVLQIYDLETGTLAADFDTASAITASPALARGRLVIGSVDGQLYCLGRR